MVQEKGLKTGEEKMRKLEGCFIVLLFYFSVIFSVGKGGYRSLKETNFLLTLGLNGGENS